MKAWQRYLCLSAIDKRANETCERDRAFTYYLFVMAYATLLQVSSDIMVTTNE